MLNSKPIGRHRQPLMLMLGEPRPELALIGRKRRHAQHPRDAPISLDFIGVLGVGLLGRPQPEPSCQKFNVHGIEEHAWQGRSRTAP